MWQAQVRLTGGSVMWRGKYKMLNQEIRFGAISRYGPEPIPGNHSLGLSFPSCFQFLNILNLYRSHFQMRQKRTAEKQQKRKGQPTRHGWRLQVKETKKQSHMGPQPLKRATCEQQAWKELFVGRSSHTGGYTPLTGEPCAWLNLFLK